LTKGIKQIINVSKLRIFWLGDEEDIINKEKVRFRGPLLEMWIGSCRVIFRRSKLFD